MEIMAVGGVRYSNDQKSVRARSTLASFLVPFGTDNSFESPFVARFEAHSGQPGSHAAAAHVGVVYSVLGLQGPAPFIKGSGVNGALGAFGICAQLQNPAFPTTPTVDVLRAGVAVKINGNELPQAPDYKFSVGAQYTIDFANGMNLVPRFDFAFTGESYGSIFNGFVNRVEAYGVINMQAQLNAADNRWLVRGYVQNLTDNNATTGLYVTDQSSGLFTNIFTLEPRRFGFAVGVNF